MRRRFDRRKIKLPKELKQVLNNSSENWYMFKLLTENQKQECVAFIMAGSTYLKRINRAQQVVAWMYGQDNLLRYYPG